MSKKDYKIDLYEYLWAYRQRRGLTTYKALADATGYTERTLNHLADDGCFISAFCLKAICTALGMTKYEEETALKMLSNSKAKFAFATQEESMHRRYIRVARTLKYLDLAHKLKIKKILEKY